MEGVDRAYRARVKEARRKAWSRFLSDRSERNQVDLIEIYRPMVIWMAWMRWPMRNDREEIEDIGMLGVYEATQKMDVKKVKSVDAYVAMVAKARMINFCQKMMHRDQILDPSMFSERIEQVMELDIDLAMDIGDALEHLSPKERLVLKLRFWGGWQMKEIAELLKCSTPNVWYIEKQGLAKLDPACYTTV